MLRERIKSALLLMVALMLGGLGAELALRISGIVPHDGAFTVTQREFERIPGLMSPNRSVVDKRVRALSHVITTDSLGYRGLESFPRARPEGELRIFVAGDSFVFGDFVSDAEALPAQLERELRERCGSLPLRTINGGVNGTTIVAHSEMARRALAVEPNLVLLQFSENDVADLAITPLWEELASNRAAKSHFPLSIVYPVLRETALWHLALAVRGKLRAMRMPHLAAGPAIEPSHAMGNEEIAKLRAEYRARLHKLTALLADHGIPLVLSAFPSHHTVFGTSDGEQLDWLAGSAEELGIPFIDLRLPLAASAMADTALYLLPHDGHPSPKGHALAARATADALAALPKLLSTCRADERMGTAS